MVCRTSAPCPRTGSRMQQTPAGHQAQNTPDVNVQWIRYSTRRNPAVNTGTTENTQYAYVQINISSMISPLEHHRPRLHTRPWNACADVPPQHMYKIGPFPKYCICHEKGKNLSRATATMLYFMHHQVRFRPAITINRTSVKLYFATAENIVMMARLSTVYGME